MVAPTEYFGSTTFLDRFCFGCSRGNADAIQKNSHQHGKQPARICKTVKRPLPDYSRLWCARRFWLRHWVLGGEAKVGAANLLRLWSPVFDSQGLQQLWDQSFPWLAILSPRPPPMVPCPPPIWLAAAGCMVADNRVATAAPINQRKTCNGVIKFRETLVARSVRCAKLNTRKSLNLFPKTVDYFPNRNLHIHSMRTGNLRIDVNSSQFGN